MLQITGEARFADVLELVLYNAALAGISLDGTRFFYVNTLRQLEVMPVQLRWAREREPFISCFCCPPNLVRTIAEVGSHAYGQAGDKVWVHLYGSNTLDTAFADGSRLRLTQKTDYPWDGRVEITMVTAPEQPCSLLLRVPGWARDGVLSLNDIPMGPMESGTYVEIRRTWSAGDSSVALAHARPADGGAPPRRGGAEPDRRPARADRLLPGVDRPGRKPQDLGRRHPPRGHPEAAL